MNSNKKYHLLLVTICLTLLSACASPYLGRDVKTSNAKVCNFDTFPASCSISDENFVFDYMIEKNGKNGEYKISGTAKYLGGPTFSSFSDATMTLLLVHDKIVVQALNIVGGSGALEKGVIFSRTFVYPDAFEACLMAYHMNTRG